MKVWWKGKSEAWGNAKGYGVHNDQMLAACERGGMNFVADPQDADVCFQVAVPLTFERTEGKPNVLFTMYEMDSIPDSWIPIIQKADMLIVPCRHNVAIFRKHYDGPIEVCQEGIDPDVFKLVDRKMPGPKEMFNFLWVGATNPRKGYELVQMAWDLWIRNQPAEVVDRTQLILKTTRSDSEGKIDRVRITPPGMKGLPIKSNVYMDSRRISLEELVELYTGSHAFLLPSFGEGWGLTLCEAQATGLPCVYTPWSGPQDFMKPKFGYPAQYKMVEQKTLLAKGGVVGKDLDNLMIDHVGKAAQASPNSIYKLMDEIFWNYETALRKGRIGAYHIHRHFTWDIAGKKLIKILEKHYGDDVRAAA